VFGRLLVTRGPRLITPVSEAVTPVSRQNCGLIQPVDRRLVRPRHQVPVDVHRDLDRVVAQLVLHVDH
jgi:hypothetical protein